MFPRSLVFALFLLILPPVAVADDCSSCSDSSADCSGQSALPTPCGDPAPDEDKGNETFVVCHATLQYKDGEEWKSLPGGGTFRVPAGKTVVEVVGTNTAVFDYQLSTEPVDAPEAKQLNAFLKKFGPYVTDVLSASLRQLPPASAMGMETRDGGDPIAALQDDLLELDRLIDGLRDIRTQVLRAYGEEDASALKAALKETCQQVKTWDQATLGCSHFFDDRTDRLVDIYTEISKDLDALLEVLPTGGVASSPNPIQSLITNARKALDDSQKVLELVRTLERNVEDGLEARACWTSPPFPISLQKGRKLTLKITPKPIATIASAGRLPKVDVAFTLLPQWNIRPTVGLSLLWADGATYPTYGTAKTSVEVGNEMVDRFEIVEKDFEDRRATYGLDLGLTARRLCTEGGRCPWLDLIVNPSDDVRALGAGLSYNFGILKIGGGVLWTKHKELAGDLAVGELLESEGALQTRDSYSGEEFFVSLSVIGWEPFVND